MSSLNWCLKQDKGIKLIEPNLNIAKSYLKDAKNDFKSIDKSEKKWSTIKEYYVCYNSFYSLLVRCGIKCEIHDCSLKLMDFFEFGTEIKSELINLKKERIGVQYYLNKPKKDYFNFTKEFLEFCEIKFIELNDFDVKEIRDKLEELK